MSTTNKIIWDYFDDIVEYPNDVAHNPIPYGTAWCYISSTFLNGFINYVKPVTYFVIDRYTARDEKVGEITLYDKDKSIQYNWKGTKARLISIALSGKKEIAYHTDLRCFCDDVIILGEIEDAPKDGKRRYMFFWYDLDTSDCCIGKFETNDTEAEVIQSVRNFLEECKNKNRGKVVEENYDNGIIDYTELPVSFLKGWLSY